MKTSMQRKLKEALQPQQCALFWHGMCRAAVLACKPWTMHSKEQMLCYCGGCPSSAARRASLRSIDIVKMGFAVRMSSQSGQHSLAQQRIDYVIWKLAELMCSSQVDHH